jgi:hypothetical protein
MKTTILAAPIALVAAGYFNTNAGSKLYVCATPQATDLDASGFAGLTWVLVGGVGNVGETGDNTNILNYDTWDDAVVQKAKGLTDAGSPEIEVARDPSDAGQNILRTAAGTNFYYAFKIEGTDVPDSDADSKPTIRYNRGLVAGPREPNGRNEDFDLEIFTLGLVQKQIKDNPVAGTPAGGGGGGGG